MPVRRLLLLGGGHAHVQVLRSFAAMPPQDTAVTLVSESRHTPYSGMVPGLVAGHYRHEEAHIELASLCAAAGATLIEECACSLDLGARRVATTCGHSHPYDLLSIDTGSVTPIEALPGAAAHAVPVKPIAKFLPAVERLIARSRTGEVRSIAVIGAGAAGFEIVLAIDHRLRDVAASKPRPALALLTDTPTVLPTFPQRARRLAEQELARREVTVLAGAGVLALDAEGVCLTDGRRLAADAVFVLTGAAAPPMFRDAGLATDDRGFVAVRPTLQSISHAEVYACGDVASVAGHPRPKAGVFAVRQGPPLTENLRRALRATPLRAFIPQREFLVLLSTGRRNAIAVRNGFALQGDWVWRWKDRIDRAFVARFAAAAIAQRRRLRR